MDVANTLPFPALISSGDYGSNSVHPFPFGAEHYVTAFLLTGVLMTVASILWLVCVLQITRKQEELVSKNQNSRS